MRGTNLKALEFLQSGGEHIKQKVEAALQHADCILAAEDHIVAAGFPLSRFCCLISYVQEGSSDVGSQVQHVLQQAPCPRSSSWLSSHPPNAVCVLFFSCNHWHVAET